MALQPDNGERDGIRIEDILESLGDDTKVQPMVYNLFEKVDPEEVKKTIESLRRTLEFKSEEVKKHLSLNHDHLFSCTDLVDQLRDFVDLSKANVQKMKRMNEKVMESLQKSEPDTSSTPESKPSTHGIDINQLSLVHEVVSFTEELARDQPLKAVESFLCLTIRFGASAEKLPILKALWISMITEFCQNLKRSLYFGKQLLHDSVDSLFALVGLAYSGIGSLKEGVFSRIQAISSICKELGIKPDTSFLRLTNLEEVFLQIFSKLLEEQKSLDIIETLNFTQFMDSRRTIKVKEECIDATISDLYCERIKLKQPTQDNKTSHELHSLELVAIDPSTHNRGQTFVQVYQSKIDAMVANADLLNLKGGGRHESGKLISSNVKFRFDFARRYFQNESRIKSWEEKVGIPHDCRLGTVLSKHWDKYCAQVVEALQRKVDFVAMAVEVMNNKQPMSVFKDIVTNVEDAVVTIGQVVDHEELKLDSNQAHELASLARSNFDALVTKNFKELVAFFGKAVKEEHLSNRVAIAYFLRFVAEIEAVKSRLDRTEIDHLDVIQTLTTGLTDSQILDSTEKAIANLGFDYRDPSTKNFIESILESLISRDEGGTHDHIQAYRYVVTVLRKESAKLESQQASDFYSNLRATYPRLVPFSLLAVVPKELPPQGKLTVKKIDFEGFTLPEYLAQSLPN